MTLPFQTIHFGLYDVFKKSMNPDNKYSPFTHVTAGALSGGVAAAITNPVDCAKTLLQTRGASHDSSIKNVSGIIKPIKIIVSTYGVKGLFRGVIPRVVYVMPGTGISWLTYEYFKRFLSKNN
ncbi:Mitochondrial RNA-splicing protein MRS4 [Zancudomyces culisetae]|uniref:Mitochondrial RNA-splicing protein MRS4 n=1 Tax=Zancudomyces culisetae TaxID=1213189 RepID=A0A1R1PYU9_ZANCU|nr:Mitochondrial RNA-splicing protein MRS4 [Zancudomyces culisetae]|eukprot:OMH86146.1 Mitochondrial RNA-splicing protein MRS4 [Zancudomyces culisetae]